MAAPFAVVGPPNTMSVAAPGKTLLGIFGNKVPKPALRYGTEVAAGLQMPPNGPVQAPGGAKLSRCMSPNGWLHAPNPPRSLEPGPWKVG